MTETLRLWQYSDGTWDRWSLRQLLGKSGPLRQDWPTFTHWLSQCLSGPLLPTVLDHFYPVIGLRNMAKCKNGIWLALARKPFEICWDPFAQLFIDRVCMSLQIFIQIRVGQNFSQNVRLKSRSISDAQIQSIVNSAACNSRLCCIYLKTRRSDFFVTYIKTNSNDRATYHWETLEVVRASKSDHIVAQRWV